MTITVRSTISEEQKASYEEDGYLIIRNLLSADEVGAWRRVVRQQAQINAYPPTLKYPEPAKYTVSGNKLAEPGMAPMVEQAGMIDAIEGRLGQPAHFAAFVAYVRPQGKKGGPAHCDYKRWRAVGSSMNWMFAIIPLTDFDVEFGQFLVSPGSHKLTQVVERRREFWTFGAPTRSNWPPSSIRS